MTDDKLRAALEACRDYLRDATIGDPGSRPYAETLVQRADAALAVSAPDEGPDHFNVVAASEGRNPWSRRPAVPVALDVERLADAIRRDGYALNWLNAEEAAKRIAREYAALSRKRP